MSRRPVAVDFQSLVSNLYQTGQFGSSRRPTKQRRTDRPGFVLPADEWSDGGYLWRRWRHDASLLEHRAAAVASSSETAAVHHLLYHIVIFLQEITRVVVRRFKSGLQQGLDDANGGRNDSSDWTFWSFADRRKADI